MNANRSSTEFTWKPQNTSAWWTNIWSKYDANRCSLGSWSLFIGKNSSLIAKMPVNECDYAKCIQKKKTTQERKKAWQPQQCCARVRYFTTPHQIIIYEMFPTFCSCTHTFWIIRTNKIRKKNKYFCTSSEILIYCWFYIETRTVVDSSKTTQMLYYHISHCFCATVRYGHIFFSLAPYSTYIHIFSRKNEYNFPYTLFFFCLHSTS